MPDPKPLSPSLMMRFMRLFFRLLYHPLAWTYDLVAASVSLGRWKQWVFSSVDLLVGQSVLELGYGPGHLQNYLYGADFFSAGLDESIQMARQARRRLVRSRYSPRLARGLAQHLPYPAEIFDSVVATFPTPYIYDSATLAEILRVLRPGGRLVILMGARMIGRSPADRFMAAVFSITGQAPSESQDFDDLLDVFRQAGFAARLHDRDLTDRRGEPHSRLMFIIADK